MNDRQADDDMIEDAFEMLRARRPVPDSGLVARVLRDADTACAATTFGARRPDVSPAAAQAGVDTGRRLLHRHLHWRGLSAAAGLAAATLVGVWIGVAAPQPVRTLEAALRTTPVVLELGEEFALALDE